MLRFLRSDTARDLGLLLLRLGLGLMFVLHGWPKVEGGPELWTKIGGAMGNVGITFAPTVWGFLAAASEFGGGVLLALGAATRLASASMAFTMVIATLMHLSKGDGLMGSSHSLEVGVVFLALVFIGAGRFSIDGMRSRKAHARQGSLSLA